MAYPFYPYQPNYFSQQMPTLPQNTQNNGVNWVQGEAGARSWLMAPNTTVLLMDSESERFFLKSTDASGMPQPLRVFEYHETTQGVKTASVPTKADDSASYATKAEFDALRARVDAMEAEHE